MDITFIGCDHDRDLEQAILRGLRSVPTPEDTRIRVCEDIAREVSDFLDLSYTTARPGGMVGGRTLPNPAGGSVIFLNRGGLKEEKYHGGETLDVAERTTAHEGCHASMYSRSEHLEEVRLASLPVARCLISQMTDIAVAEFRAECAVRVAGYPGPSHSDDRLISIVGTSFGVLRDPANSDVTVFAQAAAPICQSYVVDLAIGSAWDEVLGPQELRPLFDQGNSSRLYDALQKLPPANVRMDNFHQVIDALIPLVGDAVLDVGFEWTDEGDGSWGFYRRASEQLIMRREAVALEWVNKRTAD